MGVFKRAGNWIANDDSAQFLGPYATVTQGAIKASKGDTRGAVRSVLGQGTVDTTLEAVGLKKNKDEERARRRREEEEKARNAAAGERMQSESEKADKAFNEAQLGRNKQYQEGRDVVYNDLKNQSRDLEIQKKGLLSEAESQANDARNVYQNLGSKFDKISSDAEREAGDAMTLKQYMDPANSQAFQNVNNLYQNQAQNEGRAGLADYGVLASLGAQASGAGMAGMGPMTAGQQMGMLAQSQRQAGEAYANTQRRMQALRDQGLQTGLAFHGKAYEAGLNAKDRFRNSLVDREGLTQRDVALQQGLRGERGGFQDQISAQQGRRSGLDLGRLQENYGMDSGFDRDVLGRGNALRASRLGLSDKEFGKNMGSILRGDQAAESEAAANRQLVGSAARVAGSFFGPGGAMAGAGVGNALEASGQQQAGAGSPAPGVWGGPQNQQFNSGLGVQPLAPSPDYSMAGGAPTYQQPGYVGPNRYNLSGRMAG